MLDFVFDGVSSLHYRLGIAQGKVGVAPGDDIGTAPFADERSSFLTYTRQDMRIP